MLMNVVLLPISGLAWPWSSCSGSTGNRVYVDVSVNAAFEFGVESEYESLPDILFCMSPWPCDRDCECQCEYKWSYLMLKAPNALGEDKRHAGSFSYLQSQWLPPSSTSSSSPSPSSPSSPPPSSPSSPPPSPSPPSSSSFDSNAVITDCKHVVWFCRNLLCVLIFSPSVHYHWVRVLLLL